MKNFKGLGFILLFMVLCMFAVKPAYAEDKLFEYVGNADGTVTITKYIAEGTDVVIPSVLDGKTVSRIADNAFKGNEMMASVTILSPHIYVGKYAFAECPALTNVSIQSRAVNILDGAFYNCAALIQMDFANGVENIGKYAFRGCSNLVDMNLTGTKSVGSYAFFGCSQLTSVTTGSALKSIGKNAFADCSDKLEITLDKKSKMESYAKKNKLNYVYSDGTLIKGSEVTYKGANYIITKSDKTKGTCQFVEPVNASTVSFVIPAAIKVDGISYKVTDIKDYAFFCAKRLRQVTIGANVKSIGAGAFAFCSKLTNISIQSKKLKNVESDAFEYLPKSASIKMPRSCKNKYSKMIKR